MSNNPNRSVFGRGKGYLNAAGPQSRFIIFLVFLLIAYTILLQVFKKLAEMLQLPLFFSISLLLLLLFVGIVGIVYSHSFVGPLVRIRKSIDRLAQGDIALSLKLRESDDPMMKDLVDSIMRLCEHTRNSHSLIDASAQELFSEVTELQNAIEKGVEREEIRKRVESVRKKQDLLQKAIQSLARS